MADKSAERLDSALTLLEGNKDKWVLVIGQDKDEPVYRLFFDSEPDIEETQTIAHRFEELVAREEFGISERKSKKGDNGIRTFIVPEEFKAWIEEQFGEAKIKEMQHDYFHGGAIATAQMHFLAKPSAGRPMVNVAQVIPSYTARPSLYDDVTIVKALANHAPPSLPHEKKPLSVEEKRRIASSLFGAIIGQTDRSIRAVEDIYKYGRLMHIQASDDKQERYWLCFVQLPDRIAEKLNYSAKTTARQTGMALMEHDHYHKDRGLPENMHLTHGYKKPSKKVDGAEIYAVSLTKHGGELLQSQIPEITCWESVARREREVMAAENAKQEYQLYRAPKHRDDAAASR